MRVGSITARGSVLAGRQYIGVRRCAASTSSRHHGARNATGRGVVVHSATTDQTTQEAEPVVVDDIPYVPLKASAEASVAIKAALQPWNAFPPGTCLCMQLGDDIPEKASTGGLPFGGQGRGVTLPGVVDNMRKAAMDPRISGMYLKINPLTCGYGKLCEIRRQIAHFRKSGKFTVAYFEVGGMKEYLLASACEEIYTPPEAYVQLTGFVIENTFLRGVLEKVGVEPQIERIGKYKSAGDQLLRKDMSDAQRTVSETLVQSIYDNFVKSISEDRGMTVADVEAFLNSGPHKIEAFEEGGWITGRKYADEIEALLMPRTGGAGNTRRPSTAEREILNA